MKRFVILLSFMIVSAVSYAQKKFNGTFSNGYKGAKISFELSKDGKTIENLTFTVIGDAVQVQNRLLPGPKRVSR